MVIQLELLSHESLSIIVSVHSLSIELHEGKLGLASQKNMNEPKAPLSASFVGGIHAMFSSAVASSIKPPGVNSEVNCVYVSHALLKDATKASLR
jgi:hypothetical protein